MPVIGVVILPLRAVAVAMCCGDRLGFKNLLADGAFLMLSAVGGFGSCRVNDPLAGDVSRNIGLIATLALMPVIGVVILPLGAVAVGMCCGELVDDRILAALIAADGTLLMLQAGLGRGGRLVYLPHEGMGRQVLCAAALSRAVLVGAPMPVARRVRIPRIIVGMGVGPLICAHGDGLPDLDIAIAAAIVILDRHILLSLRELVTMEYAVVGNGFAGAIFVNRSDHHARRVEFLTGLVHGLGRRCCDLNVIHLLDDLQHLKLVEYPHIAARLSRWILKFACLFPVYGHLIPCKTGVGIPRFCVNQDFYPILDICLNRGIRCQIIPAAACITLLDGNLIDSNAHLVFC